MKTKLWGVLILLFIGLGACKYDDEALWDKLASLEERIASLEDQLSQMNSDISAMSTIVNALENQISISEVEETEDGYKITFTDDQVITIKNGQDGSDAPVISIDKEDGVYYWVQIVNGKKQWLTDEKGNKIPVTGEQAITPILKVSAKGYWLVSYDRGVTFKEILDENNKPVKAVGEDGKDGEDGEDGEDGTDGASGSNGDSFFKSVKVDGNELVLTLKDGTELRVPIVDGDSDVVTATIKGTIDLEDIEGLTIQSFVDESGLSKKEFSLNVLSNELPQLIYVTDENENVIMMARGYFEDEPAKIDAKSTALALITMTPVFVCYTKEEYDMVQESIEGSPDFTAVVSEVENIITAKKNIFSDGNTKLDNAVGNLLKGVFDKPQTKSTEITGINAGPLDVRVLASGNTVSIRNTGLNPPLELQVYYGGQQIQIPDNMIVSPSSYGGMDILLGQIRDNHYGKATEVTLEQQGEYYFFCDKMSESAIGNFQKLVFADFISMFGIKDGKFISKGSAAVGDMILNSIKILLQYGAGTLSTEEAMNQLLDSQSNALIELGVELVKEGDINSPIIKIGKFLTGEVIQKVKRVYGLAAGLANQHIRLIHFRTLASPIEFNLCYYKDELGIDYITCCTDTQLKILAGNEQQGSPTQMLKLPLTVAVDTKSDDGNDFYNDMLRIKFEVVSGGGYTKNKIVKVDQIALTASDNWTLGRSGEQKVRVVAIDLISGVELSEPVYFTASLSEDIITGESTVSGTNVTMQGKVLGYDTNEYNYGIVYSTQEIPSTGNGRVVKGTTIQEGSFSVNVSSLDVGKTYYWRAFIEKNSTYIYGDVKSLTITDETPEQKNERDILVAFYNATGGDNWTNNANWCTDAPLEDWYGITVNQEGKVCFIDLANNNLTGNGDLGGLESLSFINLSNNQLTSLNISGCYNLNDIKVHNTSLTELDLSTCGKLENLNCSSCQITELDLSNCQNLTQFAGNNGVLTSVNIQGCNKLNYFHCVNNQLSGSLNISGLQQLKGITLDNNQLTDINASNCPVLEYIQCTNNNLETVNIKNCPFFTMFNGKGSGNKIEKFYLDKDPAEYYSMKYELWWENNRQYPEFIYE